MTDILPEEDLPELEGESITAEEQAGFEQMLVRLFVVYLIVYVLVGIATSVIGAILGNGWIPFLGWTWPFWVTIIMFGVAWKG